MIGAADGGGIARGKRLVQRLVERLVEGLLALLAGRL
jgi:D-serine dehydratase